MAGLSFVTVVIIVSSIVLETGAHVDERVTVRPVTATLNPCLRHPCENNGVCYIPVGAAGYRCRCPNPYFGLNCQFDSSQMDNICEEIQPCDNGDCVATDDGYMCFCYAGYTGEDCESEYSNDPCDNQPCEHGGECEAHDDGTYTCECQDRYYGDNCEHELDDDSTQCSSQPCMHGGVCMKDEATGNHYCVCRPPYTGISCESRSTTLDNDPCEDQPCQNGDCEVADDGTYWCECYDGYYGNYCEHELTGENPCASNPCQNEGSCLTTINPIGWVCRCQDGYYGDYCEQGGDDPCEDDPCENGGECARTSDDIGYICYCPTGYGGLNCEREVVAWPTPCDDEPCMNNGTCGRGDDDDFDCTCPRDYTGYYCQLQVNIPNAIGKCEDGVRFIAVAAGKFKMGKCTNRAAFRQYYCQGPCDRRGDVCVAIYGRDELVGMVKKNGDACDAYVNPTIRQCKCQRPTTPDTVATCKLAKRTIKAKKLTIKVQGKTCKNRASFKADYCKGSCPQNRKCIGTYVQSRVEFQCTDKNKTKFWRTYPKAVRCDCCP